MANTQQPADPTLALLRQLVQTLEEKKAGDLRVLRVAAQSTITDYLVLATGNSEPHLRALRIDTEKVLDAAKAPIAGMDAGTYGSGWTVVDAYQIMVHLFTPGQREAYALEKLWRDAETLDPVTLSAQPKAPKPAKTSKSAKAAKGKASTSKVGASKKPAKSAGPARPSAKRAAKVKAPASTSSGKSAAASAKKKTAAKKKTR